MLQDDEEKNLAFNRASKMTKNYSTAHVCLFVHYHTRLPTHSPRRAWLGQTWNYQAKCHRWNARHDLSYYTAHACPINRSSVILSKHLARCVHPGTTLTYQLNIDFGERLWQKMGFIKLKLLIYLVSFMTTSNQSSVHACTNLRENVKIQITDSISALIHNDSTVSTNNWKWTGPRRQ